LGAPVTWPAAVYSLRWDRGTSGVLTIDDTHRDIVLAVSMPQAEAMRDESRLPTSGGAIPGDMALENCAGRCARRPSPGKTASLGVPTPARPPPRRQPADAHQGARPVSRGSNSQCQNFLDPDDDRVG
jgi:hypothetical protein